MNESQSFAEKYKPIIPSNIIGNKPQITQLKEWLSEYEQNAKKILSDPKKRKKIRVIIPDETASDIMIKDDDKFTNKSKCPRSCLLVTGDHGVGKSCTVMAILKQMGYTVQNINLSKIGSNKNVDENVKKLVKNNNIYYHILDNKKEKIAIVIDEIEAANSPIEKNFILTLLKKNEEKWYFPIIFISNGKHSKLSTVLKKNSNVVVFFQPSNDSLMKLLLKICHAEKMYIESEKIAYKIVEHCQQDFRRLVYVLQDLKTNYGHNQITNDDVEEYCNLCKRKDTDIDIYRATAEMIGNYKSIDECLRLYEGEKVIIPLVIHQNYIKCITCYHKNSDKAFELAYEISKSIAIGDVIENYIYSDQNWDMQEVHGFLTCVNPAFKLANEKMNINEEYFKKSLNFPMDLNRTSIRKINRRNVVNANACLKNFEIKDFIFANELIRNLIADGKYEECAELFNGYNATVENIESILKIDKINEAKSILPTTVKKKLAKLLSGA
jgi:replication factor C subunit 1